jgi:hypothetical protein
MNRSGAFATELVEGAISGDGMAAEQKPASFCRLYKKDRPRHFPRLCAASRWLHRLLSEIP